MAFMVLCSLRYAKFREHVEKEEEEKLRKEKAEMKMREPAAVGALEGMSAN